VLSQGIIQNINIAGVKICGQEHKLSLFADDVLIYLTNPDKSFFTLLSYLEKFSSVSGYKLNIFKTQLLTFNNKPSQDLISKTQLNWGLDYIKYLGVNIPKDLSKLYEVNFKPLCQTINKDIRRWDLIPILSFEECVDIVKMNILPRLLYLFQTLPCVLTNKQFHEWDRLISKFIWQGKRPGIRLKIL